MDADPAPVVDVRDLRRSYGRFRRRIAAVDGVTFQIGRGEIFGLVGPDGAGKTSVIQILAGVLAPHGGTALVGGHDVVSGARFVQSQVGYMPQGLGSNLYDSLSVRENIEFFRDLRQLPEAVYQRNRADLLKMTRLEPFLERRAATLSGGMRQKLALICTLIHLPDILLLDEPTTGVDPISRLEFWQIIRRVVDEQAATVLVSTSYMDEAARCHRIALMHGGRLVARGTPEEVRGRATGHFARLVAAPQAEAVRLLRQRADLASATVFGDEIHLQFDGELRAIETALDEGGVAVQRLALQPPDLEDVFLQLSAPGAAAPPRVQFEPVPAFSDRDITCRGVIRRFDGVTAVDGVDLSVHGGEIVGLLGPNGAGKTTLIKMMCGLLAPTAGTIVVGGVDVRRDRERIWTAIGYMSQRFSLYRDLTVAQNVRLYADLYGLVPRSYEPLIRALGLEVFSNRLTNDLPTGVRQRVSLLCAVLHHPAIVFLDEPTSGVDPHARRVFWDLIYGLSREAGVTVLVSTHYMDEASHCDRLGLMHQGRLVAEGSPADLRAVSIRHSGSLLCIEAPDPARALAVVRQSRPGAALFGRQIRVRTLEPEADRRTLAARLAQAGLGPARVESAELTMDEAFVDFIERAEARHA